MKKATFTGVGLGPGDPELITLKGYNALKEADIIFYPMTQSENGQQSFSLQILDKLEIGKPCEPLQFTMNGKDAQKYYQEAFERIKEEYASGKNVVLVSEGDLFFYSTFGYIFKLAKKDDIPCQLIPGIPAFIAASTLGGQPLVEKTTGLEVIAKPRNFSSITEALSRKSTVVIMKINVLKDWHVFLKECGHSFLYVERVGTPNEYSTTNVDDLVSRKTPYFSLLIIYPN